MDYKKHVDRIRDSLMHVKNPLFLFDDDPDGLCSFLLLYRFIGQGSWSVVKSSPEVKNLYLNKIIETRPDSIIILDKATVSDDFLRNVHVPIFWIDHHPVQEAGKMHYLNPLIYSDEYYPTSSICYDITLSDIWLAALGTIADWAVPHFLDEFNEQYPGFALKTDDPAKLSYECKIGELIRMFSFLLKGRTSDVNKCIKMLCKIKNPNELITPETKEGKFLLKHSEGIAQRYKELVNRAVNPTEDSDFLVFKYSEDSWSFTSELSNELIYRFPEKKVLVCRQKSGQMKCSIRSRTQNIRDPLMKALEGVNGRGGGHERACGAVIDVHDFDRFLVNFKNAEFNP